MDWSRAKNILIIIFICLNLLLLYYIGKSYMESRVSRETINHVENVLENKGVKLTVPIPVDITETGLPMYSTEETIAIKETAEKLPESIKPDAKEELVKYAKSYLVKKGLPMDKFIVDSAVTDKDGTLSITFVEKYGRFLIFDNSVEVKLSKEGYIYTGKTEYKKVAGISNSQKTIIPAYQILLKNYGDKGTSITSIDIGFIKHKLNQSTTGYYEGPVWRISLTLAGGETEQHFYDGYTGLKIEEF